MRFSSQENHPLELLARPNEARKKKIFTFWEYGGIAIFLSVV